VALQLGREAALIVCDRGYLKHQRVWRHQVARQAGCRVVQVESDVVVPVEAASGKAEIGARTLRPKIHRQLDDYLLELPATPMRVRTSEFDLRSIDLEDTGKILRSLKIDRRVRPVAHLFRGGTAEAERRFTEFLTSRLARYKQNHNQPQSDDISHMSPYLHFGRSRRFTWPSR
jgi:deoxyribodipyrimidine photo-lyase